MHEQLPDPTLADLLEVYERAGGVVDYVVLEPGEATALTGIHHLAAMAGMSIIDERLGRLARERATDEFPIEQFFRLRWDPTFALGSRISFSRFWGADGFTRRPTRGLIDAPPEVGGYRYAFYDPPYSLHLPLEEAEDLFRKINELVLGPEPENLEIVSWSTNWSNYFDDGNEWWGSYYWTIVSNQRPQVVVIGASATD